MMKPIATSIRRSIHRQIVFCIAFCVPLSCFAGWEMTASPTAIAQRTPAKSTFQTARTGAFSIQCPRQWQILERQETALILATPSPLPSDKQAYKRSIKVDVGFIPEGLAKLETAPKGDDATLVKVERLTINGRKAIRQYLQGGEYYDRLIITYIQRSDRETAFVSGFYYKDNPAAVHLIKAVQNSFRFIAKQ